jgi:sugar phosphate isomerase/epimerase
MTRREFGKLAATLPLAGTAGLGAAKRIPVGLQLYSVRKDCERDLPGTLSAVSKMGYEAVEFAGYYKRSAKELRKLLDDNGLKCCGTHTGLETVLGAELPKTVEFNQTIGNRNLIVPWLDHDKYLKPKNNLIKTGKMFSEIAAKLKPQGMRVGYHNHNVEFQPMDGSTPFNIFFENSSKDVCVQVDVGNAMMGGGDPVSVIRRFPGRSISIHMFDLDPHEGLEARRGRHAVRSGKSQLEGCVPGVRDRGRHRVVHHRIRKRDRAADPVGEEVPRRLPRHAKLSGKSFQLSAVSHQRGLPILAWVASWR